MGIENRDYMRDDTSSFYGGGGSRSAAMQNIIKTLIIINVVVFIAQMATLKPISLAEMSDYYNIENASTEEVKAFYTAERRAGTLPETTLPNKWFELDSRKVFQGQIWRLSTYSFLHSTDGLMHILVNMFMLHMLGRIVVQRYGNFEFLLIYLASAIFAGATFAVWMLILGQPGLAVGASGSVTALLSLVAFNWPQQQVRLYFFIPMSLKTLITLAFGFEIVGMLKSLIYGSGFFGVAHSAHLGGMVFGLLYFKYSWHLSNYIPSQFSAKKLTRFKRKPKLRVHHPPASEEMEVAQARQPIPPEVVRRVDELLEKISQSGEASLTSEEREFLHESSRKYR